MLCKLSVSNGLNWRLEDIQLGVIDFEELGDIVIDQKDQNADSNAGLRRLTNIMSVNVNLRINRATINVILHAPDPDGIQVCLAHRLKRRAFHVDGPDMIWSFDGHDKLKPYGICIYMEVLMRGHTKSSAWKLAPTITTLGALVCISFVQLRGVVGYLKIHRLIMGRRHLTSHNINYSSNIYLVVYLKWKSRHTISSPHPLGIRRLRCCGLN